MLLNRSIAQANKVKELEQKVHALQKESESVDDATQLQQVVVATVKVRPLDVGKLVATGDMAKRVDSPLLYAFKRAIQVAIADVPWTETTVEVKSLSFNEYFGEPGIPFGSIGRLRVQGSPRESYFTTIYAVSLHFISTHRLSSVSSDVHRSSYVSTCSNQFLIVLIWSGLIRLDLTCPGLI